VSDQMKKYKGYAGSVAFSAEDRVLHGRVLGIDDMVTFEGGSVEELEAAFQEAVDDYLETCKQLGREPGRTYSGNIPLRIRPELHQKIAGKAEEDGDSLNSWIGSVLEDVVTGEQVVKRARAKRTVTRKVRIQRASSGGEPKKAKPRKRKPKRAAEKSKAG